MSRALGFPENVLDETPSLVMPRVRGIADFDEAAYIQKFGHAPAYHQDLAWESSVIRRGRTGVFSDREQVDLLLNVKDLYSIPPYDKMNMWPVTRDWLRKQLGKRWHIVPD